MGAIDPTALAGRWVLSHEEDTAQTRVFRPASFTFPPSRGRESFTLLPDGSMSADAIGPTDQPVGTEGSWRLTQGDSLELNPAAAPAAARTMQVQSVQPDKLVVAKP